MGFALKEARKALDLGEFPVGCVLAREEGIVARGHRLNSGPADCNEIDHAEIVTLRRLLAANPKVEAASLTLYTTMEPCLMCYTTLLLSGVRRFVWGYEDVMGGGTGIDLAAMPPLWSSMVVAQRGGVRRQECLALFQQFFRKHTYWQGSQLARYTLEQGESKE